MTQAKQITQIFTAKSLWRRFGGDLAWRTFWRKFWKNHRACFRFISATHVPRPILVRAIWVSRAIGLLWPSSQMKCQCRGTVFCAPLLFSALRSSGPERSAACPHSTRGSPSGIFSKFYRFATRSGDPRSMHSALWWPSRMGYHVHAFSPGGAEYFCE